MIDRDKVVKGLEYHLKELTVGKTCYECPYCGDNPCEIQLIANAIALLKEQEPRVLTLEEVEDLPYGHVLIETDKNGSLRWLDALLFCKNANFSFDFITLEGRARLLGTEYNREWRCWSAKPSNEQREAVPWTE